MRNNKRYSWPALIVAFFALTLLCAPPGQAQQPKVKDVFINGPAISGTIDMEFPTRLRSNQTESGVPKPGVSDVYKVDLKVGSITIKGKIVRTPRLTNNLLVTVREAQRGQLYYGLTFGIEKGGQNTYLCDWLGTVTEDERGAFIWNGAGDPSSKPRIQMPSPVGPAPAFTDYFSGVLVGRPTSTESGGVKATFSRLVNGKTVTKTLNVDPMDFRQLALAKGPFLSYPRTVVEGKLVYDRESGNWLTDGLRMTPDGAKEADVITGSIRWLEDPNRSSNGKGEYSFNLLWNEGKTPITEDTFTATAADEDSFFAVDPNKPGLTGTVSYADTFDGETVVRSVATLNLSANNLSRAQIMAFVKLWLVGVGPLNDD